MSNEPEILYKFYWNCGRAGDVEGLFISTQAKIDAAMGSNVYFGEILGKHSEIYGTLDAGDITIKSDDAKVIAVLREVFGGKDTLMGYNPLEHIGED
jgi:hypothetical protein